MDLSQEDEQLRELLELVRPWSLVAPNRVAAPPVSCLITPNHFQCKALLQTQAAAASYPSIHLSVWVGFLVPNYGSSTGEKTFLQKLDALLCGSLAEGSQGKTSADLIRQLGCTDHKQASSEAVLVSCVKNFGLCNCFEELQHG